MIGKHFEDLDVSLISWNRVAEPQVDQYDTQICTELARQSGYSRQDTGTDPSFFDGKVAIRSDARCPFPPYCRRAPHDHPNVELAGNLVRHWPTVFIQFQQLIESVDIFLDTSGDDNISYRSYGGDYGKIGATINNHIAFAEALVHEMAHHKLRALGIGLEHAERLIKCDSNQKYQSPIRYDSLRPISAVLHAQYSFTYVAGMYTKIVMGDNVGNLDRQAAAKVLARDLSKLEFGFNLIKEHAVFDNAGIEFWDGYCQWFKRVLEDGYRILDKFRISLEPFVHPLSLPVSECRKEAPMSPELKTDDHDARVDTDLHQRFIDIASSPYRLTNIVEENLFDEMLLYCLEHDLGISLNGSARMIWEMCDGKKSIVEISQEICSKLGLDEGEVVMEVISDVKAAVSELARLGAIHIA